MRHFFVITWLMLCPSTTWAQESGDFLQSIIETEAPDSCRVFYNLKVEILNLYIGLFKPILGSQGYTSIKHIETVKNAVREQLRDPTSAEFYNVKEFGRKDIKYVCGEVNAKNGFGGYVGRRIFIGSGLGAMIASGESDCEEVALLKMYNDYCFDPKYRKL